MTIASLASEFAHATEEFLKVARSLQESDLDKSAGDGWTPRQVIHHLADSEAQSYARIRRLVAEPGSTIQGYDEGKWANSPTLGYQELPVEVSLQVFEAVRAGSLEIVKRLTEEQLELSGTHTESGPYTVRDWLRNYTNHPLDHARQIQEAIK